jgi:hypothetical protein
MDDTAGPSSAPSAERLQSLGAKWENKFQHITEMLKLTESISGGTATHPQSSLKRTRLLYRQKTSAVRNVKGKKAPN